MLFFSLFNIKTYNFMFRSDFSVGRLESDIRRMQLSSVIIKVNVDNDQEIAQAERKGHSKTRGGKRTKLTLRYLY